MSSPCVFKAGDCSKTNQDKPSPVLSGPFVCDGVKTSSSTDLNSEKSGSSPTMQPACLVVSPPPLGRLEMVSVASMVMEIAIMVQKIPGGGDYCV